MWQKGEGDQGERVPLFTPGWGTFSCTSYVTDPGHLYSQGHGNASEAQVHSYFLEKYT